ncbi:polyketide cyclase [soil metagenome]
MQAALPVRQDDFHSGAFLKSRTLTVTIELAPDRVYAFASNPENLPSWAAGLGRTIGEGDGEWIVETANGPISVRFAAENQLGVLDHVVTLESGQEILVPMRVVPNGAGSEVIFTLFQKAEMSDEQFTHDAQLVEQDLKTLKALLELRCREPT